VKQANFWVLLGLLVALPAVATAQTDEPSEDAPAEEAPPEGDSAEGAPNEGAGEEDAVASDATAGAASPESARGLDDDPEPELSSTEQGTEEQNTSAEDITLTQDIAEAEEESVTTEPSAGEDALTLEEQEQTSLPWRNSLFLYDNAFTTATFGNPGITYNAAWVMALSLRPRWYLSSDVSLRARQDLELEVTDSDSTARARQPLLADTRFEIVHSNIAELEGVRLGAGFRVTLPTSLASQAYDKILGLGPTLSISRLFDSVLQGLELALASTYAYTIALSDTATIAAGDSPGYPYRGAGGLLELGDIPSTGSARTEHAGTIGLSATLAIIENLSASTSFTWWWTHGAGFQDATVDPVDVTTADGRPFVLADEGTKMRLSTWITAGVAYDITDWLNAELYYSHLTGEFNPVASRRNPLWSFDSQVGLTATVTLDRLYTDFASDDEDSGESETRTAMSRNSRSAQ
jgi:hypothetical protein